MRELQYAADHKKGELKRERKVLDESFSKEYKKRILENFDFDSFIQSLKNNKAKRVVLFCIEELYEACHRSIVSDKIHHEYNYKVVHL